MPQTKKISGCILMTKRLVKSFSFQSNGQHRSCKICNILWEGLFCTVITAVSTKRIILIKIIRRGDNHKKVIKIWNWKRIELIQTITEICENMKIGKYLEMFDATCPSLITDRQLWFEDAK